MAVPPSLNSRRPTAFSTNGSSSSSDVNNVRSARGTSPTRSNGSTAKPSTNVGLRYPPEMNASTGPDAARPTQTSSQTLRVPSGSNLNAKLLKKRQSYHSTGEPVPLSPSEIPAMPSMPIGAIVSNHMNASGSSNGKPTMLRDTGLEIQMLASEDFEADECESFRLSRSSVMMQQLIRILSTSSEIAFE